MARFQDKDDRNGVAHRALADGVASMGLLSFHGKRNVWWQLAVTPSADSLVQYREALTVREQKEIAQDDNLLVGLGIPDDAQGTVEQLLKARRQILLRKEAEFITSLGLDASAYDTDTAAEIN